MKGRSKRQNRKVIIQILKRQWSLDRKCCSRQHNTHRSYYKTKSIENYINIDKAIDLNNNADDATLTQQIIDTINQVDGQEDENVQPERIITL